MTFTYYAALSYLAASLMASGVHHVTSLASFGGIVRSHRLMPSHLAMPLAILVTVFELVAAGTALVILFIGEIGAQAPLLFSICAVLGLAFALYVQKLLRHPEGITSCGCSSFAGPLTVASIIPALALMLVSLLGLAATAWSFENTFNLNFSVVLPLLWGATLALIINLLPASMPRPAI